MRLLRAAASGPVRREIDPLGRVWRVSDFYAAGNRTMTAQVRWAGSMRSTLPHWGLVFVVVCGVRLAAMLAVALDPRDTKRNARMSREFLVFGRTE